MSETNKPTNGAANDDDSENRKKGVPFMSRRRALKTGATVAGVGGVAIGGLWYGTQPSVAAAVRETGANNVVLGGSESDVVSVTDVTIAPEVDVAFSGFSKGVESAQIDIAADIYADVTESHTEANGTYTDASEIDSNDDWSNPVDSGDDSTIDQEVKISDTVDTTASGTDSYTFEVDSGNTATITVFTPDLSDQTSRTLGDSNEDNIAIGWNAQPASGDTADDPLAFDQSLERHTDISTGDGNTMFPQDINAGAYGLTVVNLDYTITLKHSDGDSATISAGNAGGNLQHSFDVAVENFGGSTTDADVDSNTGGSGNDGV